MTLTGMLVKAFLTFSLMLTVSLLSGAQTLLQGLPGATQHQSRVKKQDVYQLITGAMVYITDTESTEQEGYVPQKSEELSGRIERTIYDYEASESAYNINLNMKTSIIDAGFDIIFECEREACGDVNGWKLYLSKEIEGGHASQYYIVAKHARKGGGDWYVSFYVNDIANRPRSVVDVIHTGKIKPDPVVIDYSLLADTLEANGHVDIPGIKFLFNSHILEQTHHLSLGWVGHMLKNNKDMKVVLVGHTDNVGRAEYNRKLSESRANTVKQFLITEQGVDPKQLDSAGLGALSPKASNTTKEGRAINRRVELVLQ